MRFYHLYEGESQAQEQGLLNDYRLENDGHQKYLLKRQSGKRSKESALNKTVCLTQEGKLDG
jgi:hypothetical protein